MKRVLAVSLVVGALAVVAFAGVRLEDDPIRSLAHPDPEIAAVFDRYQEKSPFRGKIFVEPGELSAAELEGLLASLGDAGYREVALFERPSPETLLALAPLLPADELGALVSDAAVQARAEAAISLASLPGGDAALAELEADPLGIGPALLSRLAGGGAATGAPLRVFESPSPLDYERVGGAAAAIAALGDRVHVIGGDFFSLANYRAVQRDILVCSILTLVLNLAVFFLFTGRWTLLGLLFLGSVASYATGLLAIRAFYAEVFAVVLAYTSTFVGFNNESLVHLSGVEDEADEHRRRSLLGIGSAIGTTAIGFVVLLLGRSQMIQQMALASLGGLFGFLLFLVPFRRTLRGIRFRSFTWPTVRIRAPALVALCLACVAGIAALGVPAIETRIDTFRFETPELARAVAHFSARLDDLSLGEVVAVPVDADAAPSAALAPLFAGGLLEEPRHPLSRFRSDEDQRRSLEVLRAGWGPATERLGARLEEAGLRLELPREAPASLTPLGEWDFLDRLGALGPVRWADREGTRRFVFAGLRPGVRSEDHPELHPLSPKPHYDALLTGLSRELGLLFLGGLLAMALYLAWLQRRAVRVLYVFAPLFVAALAFAAQARATGGALNVIHLMGFSLVIALALDYTAVAVSSRHRELELSKVLLTGASTLATFGVLVLARHPVLRDLGATVAIGCAVSLAFALFVRLDETERA